MPGAVGSQIVMQMPASALCWREYWKSSVIFITQECDGTRRKGPDRSWYFVSVTGTGLRCGYREASEANWTSIFRRATLK